MYDSVLGDVSVLVTMDLFGVFSLLIRIVTVGLIPSFDFQITKSYYSLILIVFVMCYIKPI